jgi:hypothetical protein
MFCDRYYGNTLSGVNDIELVIHSHRIHGSEDGMADLAVTDR